MSVEAIAWALRERTPSSSAKCLLLVLANCADPVTGLCWPSVAYLEEATQQDRKTIYTNLKRLKESGSIADSGERRGVTGQIIVYRLAMPNTSENGTLPKTDIKTPENGTVPAPKESQKRIERHPKTEHGNQRKKEDSSAVDLPDCLTPVLWQAWVDHRRAIKKPLNDYTTRLALGRLVKLVADGHDPVKLIDAAISHCWLTFYPKPETRASRQALPSHRREVVL